MMKTLYMKILSIETSCDETGISVIEVKGNKNPTFQVLANSLNSQIKIHAPYGGVFPALAKREHLKNLPILLERTLKKAHLSVSGDSVSTSPVDLIAVTSGPGLEPALWTGIVFAKELSEKWHVPVVPVNHMEGHILSVFAEDKKTFSIPKIEFPALSLLVSGGHTELVLIKSWRKYKIIGETLDDAAGEAFDKVARMLGLPYPGGPEISRLAENIREKGNKAFQGRNFSRKRTALKGSPKDSPFPNISLPRPMMYTKNFDFSFSGLKTAVLYLIRKIGTLDEKTKMEIACEFENAVVETLVYKTKKAMETHDIKTLIVAGGVSANKYLKNELKKIIKPDQKLLFPGKKLSTDNSIMIGIAGYFKFLEKETKKVKTSKIKADGNLSF